MGRRTRRIVPVLAGSAALVALSILFTRGNRPNEAAGASAGGVSVVAPAVVMRLADETEGAATASPRIAAPSADSGAQEAVAEERRTGIPHCVVVGRVVDADGAPIADARAVLYALREWRAGSDAGERVRGPHLDPATRYVGFESRTDGEGRFAFEVPVPTAQYPALAVDAGPHRDSARIFFGRGSVGTLVEGERDVGTIRLGPTGAVQGRVVDVEGRALADVEVDLGTTPVNSHQRPTWSREDGTFLLAHAPVGEQLLRTRRTGFLEVTAIPVSIASGRTTEVDDIVLGVAPTIEGYVRAADGRPLGGVALFGWPERGGSALRTTSGEDGRFVAHLPKDARYTLAATIEGFERWGDEHDLTAVFAPGTRDVLIELVPLPSMRFVVVDAASGERIERFGLAIRIDGGSGATTRVLGDARPPAILDRPGGESIAHAREGVDACVVVAEGRLLTVVDVRADLPGGSVQTIRLERGSTVRGRVLSGDAPVDAASVVLEEWFDFGSAPGSSLPRGEIGARSAPPSTTDATGSFALTGIARGQHRLTIAPSQGAASIRFIDVEHGRDVDLGDLTLLPAGTIVGEVLTPEGVTREGLVVVMGEAAALTRAMTDADGRFRFDDVPAGTHDLFASASSRRIVGGARAEVVVEPGAVTSVTIDARDYGACEVDLLVLVHDEPAEGVVVSLHAIDRQGATSLGRTDERGRVRGTARAGEVAIAILRDGVTTRHPSMRLALAPLGRVEATVHFEFGQLVLRWPRDVSVPSPNRAIVELAPRDDPRNTTTRLVALEDAREVRIRDVAVGAHTVRLTIRGEGSDVTWTGRADATIHPLRTTEAHVE